MESNVLTRLVRPVVRPFTEFIERETSSGIILLVVSVLALILANIDVGFARHVPAIWENYLSLAVNTFRLEKTLAHWINDGLMALVFLIVGLEIKREVLEGELSSIQQASLPLFCAVGGMVVPAGLYALFNAGTATAGGWGIPMATDIAFALAIVYLLGDRVPLSLKVFLTALAIVDDLGAVMVIALFYTTDLQLNYLYAAGIVLAVLFLLNRLGLRALPVYLVLGLVLWYFTLKSGIHATVAGVLLAVTIPFRIRFSREEVLQSVQDRLVVINEQLDTSRVQPRDIAEELEDLNNRISSPAQRLENQLHGLVSFFVVPLFAFCNTSLVIDLDTLGQLGSPLSIGIMVGLLLGKPLGILLFAVLGVRLRLASLPEGISWRQVTGVAFLAGIGFTMSIFITLLAFDARPAEQDVSKLAILIASLLAGSVGYGLLRTAPARTPATSLRQ